MKGKTYCLVPVLFFWICFAATGQVQLLSNGRSPYRIVIPHHASQMEADAARTFRDYFAGISGISLPIVSDSLDVNPFEIIIGHSSRLQSQDQRPSFKHPDFDGFFIRTHQHSLVICGAIHEGTLNGVYYFLEQLLGCRFYSSDAIYLPNLKDFSLPETSIIREPAFSFREIYFPGRYDSAYRVSHQLHSHHDGSWGLWVHTFDDLVPPKAFFAEHPEYFSEIGGKRVDNGQLCLSNPDVFQVLTGNLRKKMASRPEARFWSVSQNDNFLSCQCASCQAIANKYGGESGLMIWFVNRVAELFPDQIISTLAYQYTRSAPKKIKPLPNVNIMLCTIECNRSMPIADDPSGSSFVKDIRQWRKLTGNILIWDYVVQFRNYISPFPNLHVLQPNLEFFAENGCRLMFQQGSGQALSEFSELRSYLISRLLWDPESDADAIISDFVYGFYGAAAPFIREYIYRLHDELKSSGDNLWIYGYPYSGINSFLRPALIPQYQKMFDQAAHAVKDDPIASERVMLARLPLDFAILDISIHQPDDSLSWFRENEGTKEINSAMVHLLDSFVVRCNRLNVSMLNEQGLSPDDYRTMVHQFLQKSVQHSRAFRKPVDLRTIYSEKYEAGGATALTDGIRGINDYHFNWLGFEGNDLEAVIDLGSVQSIQSVSADFLQDIQSWVFLPESLTVEYSMDGAAYSPPVAAVNFTPYKKTGAFVQTFSVSGNAMEARYLRVRAVSLKTCPSWHIGAGKNCWIFTDEIIVQ